MSWMKRKTNGGSKHPTKDAPNEDATLELVGSGLKLVHDAAASAARPSCKCRARRINIYTSPPCFSS